jgi:hypothetical protein
MRTSPKSVVLTVVLTALACSIGPLACLTPPPLNPATTAATSPAAPTAPAGPRALEKMTELDAWAATDRMSPGTNIGNTLENTTGWETGWGNPLIS